MKCGAWIRLREKRKKGSGELTQVVDRRHNKVFTLWGVKMFDQKPPEGEGYFQCDGEVVATVQIGEQPYSGGSSSVLEVNYKCKKCRNTVFFELPQDEDALSRWLTQWLDAIPEFVRGELFKKIRADNEERDRKRIELELKLAEKRKKGRG